MTEEQEPLEQSLEREGFKRANGFPLELRHLRCVRPFFSAFPQSPVAEYDLRYVGNEIDVFLRGHPAEIRLVNAAEISPVHKKSENLYFIYVKE